MLDDWEENGVVQEKRLPKCHGSDKTCMQAWALSSSQVLESSWLVCADVEDVAVTFHKYVFEKEEEIQYQ